MWKYLSKFGRKTSCTVLFLVGVIILLVILSPIYLFRWIVAKLKIICRPDLYEIVAASSAIYLQHGIEKTERSNLLITLKLQGKVHPDDLAAKMTRVLLNSKSGGKLLFPEFQMFGEYWCGFPFWKLESCFKLEEHLIAEQIPINAPVDFISKYENNLIKIPFKYGKSPWKIVLLLKGDNSGSSYFIFKCHHSLGDGHALFSILMKSVDNYVPLKNSRKVSTEAGLLSTILNFAALPILVAYQASNYLYGLTRPHPWDISVNDMFPNSRVIVKSKSSISCKNIKAASIKHSVTFTTILITAITGAVRQFFERTKQTIPAFIMMIIPVPLPSDHPGTLKNKFAMFPKLPVSESNRSRRLQNCKTQTKISAKSRFEVSVFQVLLVNVMGGLPRCIFSKLSQGNIGFQMSNFPGPTEAISLVGQQVQEMYFNIWCGNLIPIYLSVLSYNGEIQIVANGDPGLFQSEELLHGILEGINNEVYALVKEN